MGNEGPVEQFGSLGVPAQEATDTKSVREGRGALAQRDLDEMAEMGRQQDAILEEKEDELFGIEKVLRWPALKYLILIGCGLGLLFVLGQGMGLLDQIGRLPPWAQYIAYAALGLIVIAICWSMGRLLGCYFRFRRTPRVALAALHELSDRAELRERANTAFDEARARMEQYLREYPLESKKDLRRLTLSGLRPEESEKLRKARADLLGGQGAGASSEGWLADANRRFVQVIDKAVDRRITSYSLKVGLKTAIAPTGLLDAAVVMINSHLMVADLCTLYHLRATRIGTTAIVFRMFVSILAASQLEEAAEGVTDATFAEVAGSFGVNLAKQALRRVAEGAGNTLLFRRLGKATKRHLRPLQDK